MAELGTGAFIVDVEDVMVQRERDPEAYAVRRVTVGGLAAALEAERLGTRSHLERERSAATRRGGKGAA